MFLLKRRLAQAASSCATALSEPCELKNVHRNPAFETRQKPSSAESKAGEMNAHFAMA